MLATGAMSRMKLKLSLVVKRRVDCVRRIDQEQRIAVRRRTHDRLGGDIAASARPVLDDEWLTKPLRQPLTNQAREMSIAPPAANPTTMRTGRVG